MNPIRRIMPIAATLAATAMLALAGGLSLARSRQPYDPSLLVAGDQATKRALTTGADSDECTGTAGFWGPAQGDAFPGDASDARRLECKRYV
jgi:hypothetical protein